MIVLAVGLEGPDAVETDEERAVDARLVLTDEGATIADLASKNGTFVGERRLEAPSPHQDGDRIRLGRHLLVFRRAGSAAPTWTESPAPRKAD